VDGAREIVRPVALEERPTVAIPLTDGSRLTEKLALAKANVNLFSAILIPLRDEADLVEGSAPGLGRSIAIRGANRARAATSAAPLEIEGEDARPANFWVNRRRRRDERQALDGHDDLSDFASGFNFLGGRDRWGGKAGGA
jgi:hypothetical protein